MLAKKKKPARDFPSPWITQGLTAGAVEGGKIGQRKELRAAVRSEIPCRKGGSRISMNSRHRIRAAQGETGKYPVMHTYKRGGIFFAKGTKRALS